MEGSGRKAIVISQYWAGIMASLITAMMVGMFAYAWNANAEIAVMKRDVREITEANLNSRLVRMESKLESTNEKLDILIGRGRVR